MTDNGYQPKDHLTTPPPNKGSSAQPSKQATIDRLTAENAALKSSHPIKCGECKHQYKDTCVCSFVSDGDGEVPYGEIIYIFKNDTDFCSYAERKDDTNGR